MDTTKPTPLPHPTGRDRPTGILNLHKRTGVTSRDVVDRVTRLFRREKVGHAGTLDPLASGVLVVCVGKATRLVEMIQRQQKTYRTTICLGARSNTDDADGTIAVEPGPRVPDRSEIDAVIPSFLGEIEQRPPVFSALKIKGRRAYDLARAGEAVELAPRSVRIDRIEVVGYEWPRLELEIDCGGGTYIRSIARDLGDALGCGGYVEILTRTRIGAFPIDQAVNPDLLDGASIDSHMLPALAAVCDLPRVVIAGVQLDELAQGRKLSFESPPGKSPVDGLIAVVDPSDRLVALAEFDPADGLLQPRKVLI